MFYFVRANLLNKALILPMALVGFVLSSHSNLHASPHESAPTKALNLSKILSSKNSAQDFLDKVAYDLAQNVQSYQDWHEYEWHPNHIFSEENLLTLSAENLEIFCSQVVKLPTPQQLDFYTAISLIKEKSAQWPKVGADQVPECSNAFVAIESHLFKNQMRLLALAPAPESNFQIATPRPLPSSQDPWENTPPYTPIEPESNIEISLDLNQPENIKRYFGKELFGNADRVINLTFDDGPHHRLTARLLDILREENVKVNFYVLGKGTRNNPELVRRATKEGHIVGNHSWSHLNLSKKPIEFVMDDIQSTFDEIRSVLGDEFHQHRLFRFPYGASTADHRQALKDAKIPEFFWTIDTLDWKIKSPDQLLAYALGQIKMHGTGIGNSSGIILFHDVQPQTLSMIQAFIRHLKADGYRFATIVTVPEQHDSH